MIETFAQIPDPGEPIRVGPPLPKPEQGWTTQLNTWLGDTFPAWVWPTMWLATAGLLFAALLVLRWRLRKTHTAAKPGTGETTKKLGNLFHVAVGFAMLLWAGVLIGSGKNLIGWARDTLGWRNGWDWLVPFTLDGVAIAFAVLMFAAVRAGRSATRAYRVVWTATIASAAIGFSHEYDGTTKTMLAAIYLGLLALGAMAILHELLDLFRSHTEKKAVRINPVFGLRWVTYTPNTVCAWLAWQNHPPRPLPAKPTDEQVVWYGSVRHAVAHLETVRRAKRIHRRTADLNRARSTVHPWLAAVPPVRELVATLSAERTEMAEIAARLDQVAADYEAEKTRAEAAENRAETERQRAEAATADQAIAEAETAETQRRAEKLRLELEAEMTRLRTETTNTIHRTESMADRRVTTAQAEKEQALARIDQLEQQWIDAKQEAAVSAQRLSAAQTERLYALRSAEQAENEAVSLRSALTEATEKHAAELAENAARFRAELAENEARVRAEMGTVNLSEFRNGERSGERRKPTAGQRSKAAENRSGGSNQPRMSDGEAVQALLRAHPEPGYEWKQLEVQAITGAGFGRIPRLISAVAEHHRAKATESRSAGPENSTTENVVERSGDTTGAETTPNGEDTEIARTPATVAAG
ncbi:DUF2637 domain-containing protein [Micromonospora sp. NPDC000207]|uniref:DUF2637 domain-containing protein n=1 Tax=Micromonospora sp. NPDC000207 TaxID=3154246 RepID=UPI0033190FD1